MIVEDCYIHPARQYLYYSLNSSAASLILLRHTHVNIQAFRQR